MTWICAGIATLAALASTWFAIDAARQARRAEAAAVRAEAATARAVAAAQRLGRYPSITYEEPMRAQPTPPWPNPHIDTT